MSLHLQQPGTEASQSVSEEQQPLWTPAEASSQHQGRIQQLRKGGQTTNTEHEPITGVWGGTPRRAPGQVQSPLKRKAF